MIKFLISLLLLLTLSVQAQLNPTAASKGLINTNTSVDGWLNALSGLKATTNKTGLATNVPVLFYETFRSTNNIPLSNSFSISGSTIALVNGTYTMSSYVAGSPEIIWTNNNASSPYIVYLNDPIAPIPLTVLVELEAGDEEPPYFADADAFLRPVSLQQFLGPDSSAVLGGYQTNAVVTPFIRSKFTNATLVTGITTNFVIDPVNGNDLHAAITNGIPWRTLASASVAAASVSNPVFYMQPGFHTDDGSAYLPVGSTLYGNKASIANHIYLTNNCKVYDFTTSVQPNVNITNPASYAVIENVQSTSTDYVIIDNLNGVLELNRPRLRGPWDGVIINNMYSNALLKIKQPDFYSEQDGLTGVTWGSHGIGWKVSPTNGGKVQIVGGAISVINPTNAVFNGNEILANGCVVISNKFGTTGIGSASLEILGTSLIHASTNAGVTVSGLSNMVNIPITGWYVDVIAGATPNKPYTSSTVVQLDPAKGSSTMTATNGFVNGSAQVLWKVGTGSPEGIVTAPIGSMYGRTDGGVGTVVYVKQTGTGNTGWVPQQTMLSTAGTGSQTGVQSSTTLVNITGATLPLAAGTLYAFEAWIPFTTTGSASGYKFAPAFSGTALSTTENASVVGPTVVMTNFFNVAFTPAQGAAAAGNYVYRVTGGMYASTAGNLTIQMAQNVSDAATIDVAGAQGVWMKAWPIYTP